MSLWQLLWRSLARFFRRLSGEPEGGAQTSFPLEVRVARTLQALAEQQQRPEDEIASELIDYALAQHDVVEYQISRWSLLTEREQQVTALICLGLTNRQIAAHLQIAHETARTHVRNVLYKFELRTKSDLRLYLSGWDFSSYKDKDF